MRTPKQEANATRRPNALVAAGFLLFSLAAPAPAAGAAAAPPARSVAATAADPSGYVPGDLAPRPGQFVLPTALRGGGITYPPIRIGSRFVALTEAQGSPPGGGTRVTGLAGFTGAGDLLWQRPLTAPTAPVPLGGNVAVIDNTASGPVLWVLDPSGAVRLRRPLAGVADVAALASEPAGLVALVDTGAGGPGAPCTMVALDRSGRARWHSAGASFACGGVLAQTHGLVLAQSGNRLVAVSSSNGAVLWTANMAAAFALAGVVNGIAVLRSRPWATLSAIDLRHGAVLWRRPVGAMARHVLVTAAGVIGCRQAGPSCQRFSLGTGRVAATISLPGALATAPVTLMPLVASDAFCLVAVEAYPPSGPRAYVWQVALGAAGVGLVTAVREPLQAAYTFRSQGGAFSLTPQGIAWRW